MAESLLHAAGLSWHAGGDVTVSVAWGGATYLVHVPVSSVRFEIRKAAAEVGLTELNSVGDLELVGWFGSKIVKKAKKAAKSVYKKASKVAKRTVRVVKSVAKNATIFHRAILKKASPYARQALHAGTTVLNSKYFAAAIAGSAIICPAIGGPALGAYMAAKGVQASLMAGGAVARTAVNNVQRLARGQNPTVNQRLLLSSLRSYPS